MAPISDYAVTTFLTDLASTEPAPGAGSAAAVSLALGLGCARKALAMTLKHHPDRVRLGEVEPHLAGLVDQALAGAAADMRYFGLYIEASRRPHDDPGRHQAEVDALTDLVAIGENLVMIADEARRLIIEVRATIIPTMANDIAAALSLIAAARTVEQACADESRRGLNP